MIRLPVRAKKPYEVVIDGDFSSLNAEVKKVFNGEKIAVITDENTSSYYASVKSALEGFSVYEISVKAGERSKSLETYAYVLSRFADLKLTRKDCVLTLGGGVVGDLGGFAASTYMRGVTYIQCPTTLLADVDSSVGGKTAIDLPEGKNLAGTFYQPSLVYINVSCLKTLPKEEIACGMGEVVKYAFLSDSITADDIKRGDYEEIIFKCVEIKAEIVEKDEFDLGVRAILNLGHTIGHAIENLSAYTLSHGLCVAKGIGAIIDLSADFYSIPAVEKAKMKELLNVYPFDLTIPYSLKDICEKLLLDKKSEEGGVNFVLLKGVGKPCVEKLSLKEIRRIFS
ncbi:MAG: 3-dehydroquinate synthase [Clostridia bacterium]|nr:3-dehydroquinate synthase [Clostridia bacterium]